MANLAQDKDYGFNCDGLLKLNPELLKPYLDMLFMDALVFTIRRTTACSAPTRQVRFFPYNGYRCQGSAEKL